LFLFSKKFNKISKTREKNMLLANF